MTELFVQSASDCSIVDRAGNTYSVAAVKKLWKAGKVSNWNLAFQRLVNNDFDMAKTKQQFADGTAARMPTKAVPS